MAATRNPARNPKSNTVDLQALKQHIQSHPEDAEAYHQLGNYYGQLQQYDSAIEAYKKCLSVKETAQTHLAIGGAYKLKGDLLTAKQHFDRASLLAPNTPLIILSLAELCLELDMHKEARDHFQKLLHLNPRHADAHYGLGYAYEQMDHLELAIEHLQKAIELDPANTTYQCTLAHALASHGEFNRAKSICRKLLRKHPRLYNAIAELAHVYDLTGEHEKAWKTLQPLVAKGIPNPSAASTLANICRHVGKCDKAIEYIELTLEKFSNLPPKVRQNLHMTAGRMLDSQNEFDKAFAHFKAGNESASQYYNPVEYKQMIDRLIETFDNSLFSRLGNSGIQDERPIFIVGMPRSGTTLTEQILAAHPEVTAMGELESLGRIIKRISVDLAIERKIHTNWPEAVNHLLKEDLRKYAEVYLQALEEADTATLRFTDKMPHNFYALGLIQLLFPKARIIHCIRDPMDTCLSIYMQNFKVGHRYSHDLFHIGTHYHQYQRLMAHWKSVLSISIHEISYESLVADPEEEVSALLGFCGLDWHEGCLDFHKTRRTARTASYDQVRQKLYTGSIGRWKHYAQHLEKLKEGLDRGF